MLRIVLLLILLFSPYIYAADNNSLLDEQLEAINRQLNSGNVESDKLDLKDNSPYKYNQNVVYHPPSYVKEQFYVGINRYIGYFESKSDIERYNTDYSTAFFYFRLGYIFKTNNRLEVTWINEAKLNYNYSMHKLTGLNVNAIVPFAMNDSETVFFKLQAGVGVYDFNAYSLEGISALGEAGLIANITDEIEFDISYLYQYFYWKDLQRLGDDAEISNTKLTGVIFGLKYKF